MQAQATSLGKVVPLATETGPVNDLHVARRVVLPLSISPPSSLNFPDALSSLLFLPPWPLTSASFSGSFLSRNGAGLGPGPSAYQLRAPESLCFSICEVEIIMGFTSELL